MSVTDTEKSTLKSHLAVTLRCGGCGKTLALDAPVLKYNYMLMGTAADGRLTYWFPGHICLDCASSLKREPTDNPSPCYVCKRPVFGVRRRTIYAGDRFSPRTLCSKRCENTFYRNRQRKLTPIFTCSSCGRSFSPNRADAKHCSPACKQKAYRQRAK